MPRPATGNTALVILRMSLSASHVGRCRGSGAASSAQQAVLVEHGDAELLAPSRACCRHRRRRRRSRSSSTRCRRPCRRRPRSAPWPRRARASAACRSARASGRRAARPRARCGAPSGQRTPAARSCADHLAVVRLGEEPGDALGDAPGRRRAPRAARRSSAAIRASRLPKCRARSLRRRLADVADAEREDEARQRRVAGSASIAATTLAADFSAIRSSAASSRDVQPVEVGRRAAPARRRPAGRPACRPGPRCPCARRLAKCSSACLRCAGQTSPPVQRATASSGRRTIAEPHSGHARGITNGRARPAGRRSATTRTTSGITSPARRTIDGVADAHVLAPDLVLVVQRRVGHRDAADEHRLRAAPPA